MNIVKSILATTALSVALMTGTVTDASAHYRYGYHHGHYGHHNWYRGYRHVYYPWHRYHWRHNHYRHYRYRY